MLQQSQSLTHSKRQTATPKNEEQSHQEQEQQPQFQPPSSLQFASVSLNRDTSLRSVALTKNDSSFRSFNSNFAKRSESLLSPHNSVFQALQNPDLDLDLSHYNGTINGSFDQQRLPAYQNNEFSITSWQSISSCLSGEFQQDPLPQQLPQPQQLGNPPPPSGIALFTNPFAATGQTSLNNASNSNTSMGGSYNFVSRNRSPNIGSILSSSDNEERLLDDLNIGSQEDTTTHRVIVFGSESEDSGTDDDEYTVDSSTIIPSFVMPRVSIPSLGGGTNTGTGQTDADTLSSDEDIIKVQVVGAYNNLLVERLNSYRKILKSVEFFTSNQSEPHLLLLLVNQENYLLPSLINKPYIPIIVQEGNSVNPNDLLSRLFKGLMVCEPLILKTINDDIMMLIDFLNNLERMDDFEAALRASIGSMASSLKLNTVNSILMTKTNSSGVCNRRESSSTIKSQRKKSRSSSSTSNISSSDSNKISKKKKSTEEIRHLKAKLMLGITFGVVSLTFVLIWRELTSIDSGYHQQMKSSGISIQSSSTTPSTSVSASVASINLPPVVSPRASSGTYSVFLDSEAPFEMFSVDELLLAKFDEVTTEFSRLGKLLITESFMLIERAKLALVHIMSLFN